MLLGEPTALGLHRETALDRMVNSTDSLIAIVDLQRAPLGAFFEGTPSRVSPSNNLGHSRKGGRRARVDEAALAVTFGFVANTPSSEAFAIEHTCLA